MCMKSNTFPLAMVAFLPTVQLKKALLLTERIGLCKAYHFIIQTTAPKGVLSEVVGGDAGTQVMLPGTTRAVWGLHVSLRKWRPHSISSNSPMFKDPTVLENAKRCGYGLFLAEALPSAHITHSERRFIFLACFCPTVLP